VLCKINLHLKNSAFVQSISSQMLTSCLRETEKDLRGSNTDSCCL